jgi:hypothetical protein
VLNKHAFAKQKTSDLFEYEKMRIQLIAQHYAMLRIFPPVLRADILLIYRRLYITTAIDGVVKALLSVPLSVSHNTAASKTS